MTWLRPSLDFPRFNEARNLLERRCDQSILDRVGIRPIVRVVMNGDPYAVLKRVTHSLDPRLRFDDGGSLQSLNPLISEYPQVALAQNVQVLGLVDLPRECRS